jgi:hypothetical protein
MNFFIIHQSQGTLPTCIVLMPKIVDIRVFMNFFIIHQSQGTLPTCIVLMLKIVVKRNKMFCLSFCALSIHKFSHVSRVPTHQCRLYFCTRKRTHSRPYKSYGISKWPIPQEYFEKVWATSGLMLKK